MSHGHTNQKNGLHKNIKITKHKSIIKQSNPLAMEVTPEDHLGRDMTRITSGDDLDTMRVTQKCNLKMRNQTKITHCDHPETM